MPLNPTEISKFISNKIATVFKGDRVAAEKFCLKKIRTELKHEVYKEGREAMTGINKLSFFVGLCLDLENLSPSEKSKLEEWILEKGKSEFKYIELSNKINFKKHLVKEIFI